MGDKLPQSIYYINYNKIPKIVNRHIWAIADL